MVAAYFVLLVVPSAAAVAANANAETFVVAFAAVFANGIVRSGLPRSVGEVYNPRTMVHLNFTCNVCGTEILGT